MKIGIDSRAAKWYRGTGIGTYSYQIINSLSKIDNINDYILYAPKDCELNTNLNSNFKIETIENNSSESFWHEVNSPNINIHDNMNIYHVPQNGIGLPIEKKCPYVITLHDVIPLKMPETVSETFLKIFNEEIPRIIPLCDGIITVSEYSKKDIVEAFNYPEEKVYVTHLASEDIYRPIDKVISKSVIKEHYGISDPFILYIGGFSPRKNILGLIEAFSMLKHKKKSNLKLVIAGKWGISYKIYKKRVEELNLQDDVLFPGFISMEHIPYLYNASELFVYPSFYEGFGLPPIEAMACGIPVITSNATSIPEIVKDSALYIDPFNTEDLYEKICSALYDDNLRSNLITSGYARASQLSWQRTATETLEIYNSIVNT